MNGWCFRGIYKGGLWENDLHVSAQHNTSPLCVAGYKKVYDNPAYVTLRTLAYILLQLGKMGQKHEVKKERRKKKKKKTRA